MSAIAVLKDPQVLPSVAWAATKKLFGPSVAAWEFETIRLELQRRGVEVDESLAAKIFGAMTIEISNDWTFDHDVLFAFALSCCGVPSNGDGVHHPTPEQLCWAIHDLHAITGKPITDDEGFDPDAIDPAIGVLLHDDGYVVTPDELSFAQDALDKINRYGALNDIKKEVQDAWKVVSTLPVDSLKKHLSELDDEPAEIQIRRLGDCRLYVAERQLRRAKQHALLNEQ